MNASLLLEQRHLRPDAVPSFQTRSQSLAQASRTAQLWDLKQEQVSEPELGLVVLPQVLEFTPLIFSLPGRVGSTAHQNFSDAVRETILNEAQGLSLKFRRRIEELYDLPANWDGGGAPPI